MTEINNGTIMRVNQFLSEARSGQLEDIAIRKKPIKLDRDGKPKEGSSEIKLVNKKEVENFTQAPIYEICVDTEGVNGKQYVKERKIVLDCNTLSGSVEVIDIPKSQDEIEKIQEQEEKARLKQKERESENGRKTKHNDGELVGVTDIADNKEEKPKVKK